MAFIYALRQQGQLRFRPSLNDMNDDEIMRVTRFTRDAVDDLCSLLHDDIERKTRRSNALTVEDQVLCGLQFLSSGSFQWMVGRSCGLSQPSASRAVTMVTETLCKRAHDYIRFPTSQHEINAIKQSFHTFANFPIGASQLSPLKSAKRHLSTAKGCTPSTFRLSVMSI